MPIAQDMKNLVEEIEVSHGERVTTLEQLIAETQQIQRGSREMQRRFRDEHKERARALGSFLDESESARIAEFKKMLVTIQSRRREREDEVAAMIQKFKDALEKIAGRRKRMAGQLKDFLSESEAARLEEFKTMLSDIKSREREREEETAKLLSDYHKDLSQARGHLQNLAKIMAAKRTGKRVPAEVPKRVEEEAEEALGEGELKARALGIILDNPQGISLRQLGEKLRVAYVRLARPISELVNKGKATKRDSLYYPTRTEGEA